MTGHATLRDGTATEMRIAIIGAGNIGGNVARQAARAGHDLTLGFARDVAALEALAHDLGGVTATPMEAVRGAELVVVAVPWSVLPQALLAMGPLDGKIVVDTTNQFGSGPMPAAGETAAAFNARRLVGARYVKAFNTLTAAFQVDAAGRSGNDRVVQWVAGDDGDANQTVVALIDAMGYAGVVLAGTRDCAVMEAPRRPGAVYGEEYRLPDAAPVVDAVRAGRPIPPRPAYV